MTVYLCTCGTSAAKNLPRESTFNAKWVKDQGGITPAAESLLRSFTAYRMTDEQALTRNLSAEIHSLARIGPDSSDRVVLFSSETEDGQSCAQAVSLYLQREIPGLVCVVEVIEGLQVRDAGRFRTEGVVNFIRKALHEIAAHGAEQCVLNPTGSFKSLVPYTVLIGMIKGVEARYIFEQSAELITLPAMPVEFARERIEPFKALLERIEQDSYVPKVDWETAIPYDERRDLAPLFEQERDAVTLSPVGFLVWEEIRQPVALVPYLSRVAIDDLAKVRSIDGCKPLPFIQRVSRDPAQLESAKHETFGPGLFWLKPGQHTRDRYLVSVDGWRLLVWRIAEHAEYDEMLDKNRKPPLGKRIIEERRSRYEPFFRMDLYETG